MEINAYDAHKASSKQRLQAGDVLRMSSVAKALVKQVATVAGHIDLIAINASLAVKGNRAGMAGFRVVASELRRASAELNVLMGGVMQAMSRMVTMGSRYLGLAHRLGLLPRQSDLPAQVAERYRALILEREAVMAELAQAIQREWAAVRRQLKRAQYLIDMARQLSRAARVEAVYCGPLGPKLSEVAEAFSGLIDDIAGYLPRLIGLNEVSG